MLELEKNVLCAYLCTYMYVQVSQVKGFSYKRYISVQIGGVKPYMYTGVQSSFLFFSFHSIPFHSSLFYFFPSYPITFHLV